MRSRMSDMTDSWITQRSAAIMSDVPIPRPRTSERMASRPMKEKARATLRSATGSEAARGAIVSRRHACKGRAAAPGLAGEMGALGDLGEHGDRHL